MPGLLLIYEGILTPTLGGAGQKTRPDPFPSTIDDLDPESTTTDALIAMVRSHREGEDYPTAEVLLGNLGFV